jgi:hypothetical protein
MQDVRNKVESIVEAKTAKFTASYSLGIKDITSKTSFYENISFTITMLFHVCVLYTLQGQDISQRLMFCEECCLHAVKFKHITFSSVLF